MIGLWLLACDGPAGKTDCGDDGVGATTTGCEPFSTGEDTGMVMGCPVHPSCDSFDEERDVMEVCGDTLDNDCDGETDEPTCMDGCLLGEVPHQAGLVDAVSASNDPTFWLTGATNLEDEARVYTGYHRQGAEFVETWQWTATPPLWSVRPALFRVDGRALMYTTDNAVAVILEVDEANGTVSGAIRLGDAAPLDGVAFGDIYSKDGSLSLLVFTGDFSVLRLEDPGDGSLEDGSEAAATYRSAGQFEEEFGWGLMFLPDPGGDGVPDVVVGAPGQPYSWESSGLYFFDGTLTGDVSVEDASAVMASDSDGDFGYQLARTGDLDGDGHEELVSYNQVLFGPFEGDIDYATFERRSGGDGASAAVGINDDDVPDLVIRDGQYEESRLLVFLGPVHPGAYTADEAAWTIPVPPTHTHMELVQIDDDPELEIISQDGGFGNELGGDPEGLLGILDFTCR